MSTEHFIALWDCEYCDAVGNLGFDVERDRPIKNCPQCGGPVPEPVPGRGREHNPYYIPDEDAHVRITSQRGAEYAEAGADWTCPSCLSLNSQLDAHCTNCGANKAGEHSEYFLSMDVYEDHSIEMPTRIEENALQEHSTRQRFTHGMQTYQSAAMRAARATSKAEVLTSHRLRFFAIAGAVVLAILLIGMFFHTQDIDVEIVGFSWERTLYVEDYQPRSGEDWEDDMPSDAYDRSEERKIHHYDQVQVGTRIENRTRIETYQSGTRQNCSNVNNGNGTFSRSCSTVPTYSTRSVPYTVTVPVYERVPRYATYVTYTVDRWKIVDSFFTSGSDQKPYWRDVTVGQSVPLKYGDTRIASSRSEDYVVILHERGGKSRTWRKSFNQEIWQSLAEGESMIVKLNFYGVVLEVIHPEYVAKGFQEEAFSFCKKYVIN